MSAQGVLRRACSVNWIPPLILLQVRGRQQSSVIVFAFVFEFAFVFVFGYGYGFVFVFVFVFVMDSLGESGKGERDLGVEVAGEGGSM